MSAIRTLRAARAHGIELRADGSNLDLNAKAAPPPELLQLLVRYKRDIVALLRRDSAGWSAEDWQVYFDERAGIAEFDGELSRPSAEISAFEECITKWQTENPPSVVSSTTCLQCGQPVAVNDTTLLPVPTSAGLAGRLHERCASTWRRSRRWQAHRALSWLLKDSSEDRDLPRTNVDHDRRY